MSRSGQTQQISAIDPENKTILTSDGETIPYRQLLWAADQKKLYESIAADSLKETKTREAFNKRKALITDMAGNDSVLTLYLSVNLDKSYFEAISAGHFFYTPSRAGQSSAGEMPEHGTKQEILAWLAKFLALTTYEISIPVLRDNAMAPAGKTGLIISLLFDFGLTKTIREQGWEEEFREGITQTIIGILNGTIYPGLAEAVLDSFTSTPLTLQRVAGTTDGAITGWSFTNHPMPAENRLVRIANAVNTPIPDVHQAGQWTYSPSGFPVALIQGNWPRIK